MYKIKKIIITCILCISILAVSSCDQNMKSSVDDSKNENHSQSVVSSSSDFEIVMTPTKSIKPIKFDKGEVGSQFDSFGVMNNNEEIYTSLYNKTLQGYAIYLLSGSKEITLLGEELTLNGEYPELGFFNILGDKLYFCHLIWNNPSFTKNGFFSYDLKTKQLEHYAKDEYINQMLVVDNWIFYTNADGELFAMQTDGTQKRKIINISCSGFYVSENRIFYLSKKNGFLYSSSVDGIDQKLIYNKAITNYFIDDGWIYISFSSTDESNTAPKTEPHISKMKFDGSSVIKISTDGSSNMCVIGGWVYYLKGYYIENLYATEFYRIKTDGTGKEELIRNFQIRDFGVFGDKVIYNVYVGDGYYDIYTFIIGDDEEKLLREH